MFELSAFFFRTSRRKYFSAVANVEQHRNGAEPNDDLTMMCLRVG